MPVFVREAEIHQQDPAALLAHHVAGLDVAVEKSRGVNRTDRPADVDADQRRFARTHRTLRGEQFRQRLCPGRSRSRIRPARRADPRRRSAATLGCRTRAIARASRSSALASSSRLRRAGEQELQRDVALERRVERAVDLAERAAPDALQALERSPAVQRIRRWRVGRALVSSSGSFNERSRNDQGDYGSDCRLAVFVARRSSGDAFILDSVLYAPHGC